MMQYYIVDAFSDQPFHGNPAGVCLPEKPLDSAIMQQIAAENNLAETAFVARQGADYSLRWFTPEMEIDLCGHATLASGYVILRFVDREAQLVRFHTQSGVLTVRRSGDLFELDLPSRPPRPATVSPLMEEAVGAHILEAHLSRDLLLLLEDERTVRNIQPDMPKLAAIPDALGVVVTARGESCDFVSRYFSPCLDSGAPEDPVTGSTHCNLVPFWAERLKKTEFIARQLSRRGGTLYCKHRGDRILVAGHASLYLTGTIHTESWNTLL